MSDYDPTLVFGNKLWWAWTNRDKKDPRKCPGLHCPDGPAIVWADGTKEYWLNGARVSKSDVMGDKK